MLTEPVIRFPVTCPKCRQEVLATLPLGIVAAALISGRAIRLYATCHDVYWDAHHTEIEQIREYMAAPSLQALPATGDIGGSVKSDNNFNAGWAGYSDVITGP
jgi:hypothetical protein